MRLHLPVSLLVLVAAGSQLGATDCGTILRDPGFDLWCGEVLCTWKLERGEVKRVPTWHEGDAGVELVGPDVAIEQLAPVTSQDTTCLRFDLVANVAEDAEVRLNFDVFGDGSVEHGERLPTSHWKPLSYRVAIRAPYAGVRFELTKRGPGTAVVAQISAETAPGECEGLSVITPAPAPLGADCDDDGGCASGKCRLVEDPGSAFGIAEVCVGCDPADGFTACGASEVCGLAAPSSFVLHVPVSCVPVAGHALGEQCLADDECATGVCAGFVCSTCDAATPCAASETCAAAWPRGPRVCSPGGHLRLTDEPCATADDCASGRCVGPDRKQCGDGRVCATPAQCPVEQGLEPGPCELVGTQGGRCG